MKNRELMYNAAEQFFKGKIAYHSANVEVYLNNPVAIGEHGDLMEELDKNIGLVTDYQDKLETLRTMFNQTTVQKELLNE